MITMFRTIKLPLYLQKYLSLVLGSSPTSIRKAAVPAARS
jgi:hypothetical protein